MSKKSERQLQREIAEFLVLGVPEPAPRGAKVPRRGPTRPAATKSTKLEVPGRSGYPFTVILRPAKVTTSYAESSGGIRTVTPAKRSDDTWLVATKSGHYLGVLKEGAGREPWAVAKLAEQARSIGKRGVRVRNHLLTGVTWQEAVADGARVWWAP